MANKRNAYDECSTCICNDCTSVDQCNTCEDCSGEAIEKDAPFAFHKLECDEFTPQNTFRQMDEQCRWLALNYNRDTDNDGALIKTRPRQDEAGKLSNKHFIEYTDFCERLNKTYNKGYKPEELSVQQEGRIDEVNAAVHELLKVMTCNPGMKWDMVNIGEVADRVADFLTERGYIVYYPALVYDEAANTSISEFHSL